MHAQDCVFPLCRHTKADGLLCKAPALRASAFCYFHQRQRRTRPSTFAVPTLGKRCFHPLQDQRSIQHSLQLVLNGLASGRLSRKQSGRMLYALQLAIQERRKSSME